MSKDVTCSCVLGEYRNMEGHDERKLRRNFLPKAAYLTPSGSGSSKGSATKVQLRKRQ